MITRMFAVASLVLLLPFSLRAQTCAGLPATIVGTAAGDHLLGTAGADVIVGLGGNDVIEAGAGDDIICGGDDDDLLIGENGNDRLLGEEGDDNLTGGAGNDVLKGGAGSDVLDGGIGVDTADYSDKTTVVELTLNGASDATVGGVAEDTIRNIENLTGGAGADILTGDLNDNLLSGGAGDDVLRGGAGSDVLDGGTGVDTADYSDKPTAVVMTLNGATNAPVTVGGVAEDTVRNVENIVAGSGNDTLTGDLNANVLYGGAGNDVLLGGSGNDSLRGGGGDDQLTGGAGDDVMVGSAGADQCDGVSGIDSADSACEVKANLDSDVLFLTLYAPDGTPLDGELYVPTNDAATAGTREVAWVFRHGAMGNYASGVNQSAGLWGIAHGFTVLSLNGRDWGTAAGGGNTLFEDTTLDMGVGIDFLERIGFDKVFVAGHSGGTQAAGVYPALSNNDPRMVAVGLFGVVRDGREAAINILFAPRSELYDPHIALSQQLVAEGRGEEVLDFMTLFGVNVQRSGRTFLSYWGPDSRSVVVREIAAAAVPVFLLRAQGDGFTPDAYSVDVRDAALAAGVDATYVEIPYQGPVGDTGINAHSLLGVEQRAFQETTDWLLAKVPAAANFVSSRPARVGSNYLPLPEAGPDSRLVTVGGERMTLNGLNSVDLDGSLVTYAWTQTSGRAVRLQGADSAQVSFEVPGSTTTLRFALAVTDDQGATATDTVTVEVASLQPGGGSSSADLLMLGVLVAGAAGGRRSSSRFRRSRVTG